MLICVGMKMNKLEKMILDEIENELAHLHLNFNDDIDNLFMKINRLKELQGEDEKSK